MQILHVVHQYLPEKVGGTELYTQALARHQVSVGHSVSVFYPSQADNNGTSPVEKEEGGVRVYSAPVGPRSANQVFRDAFFNKKIGDAFTAVLQQEQPHLIHIQHLMGLPLNIVKSMTKAGIPYLITLHDYWHLCPNAQLLTNYDSAICWGPSLWLNCARCALARTGHNMAAPLIPAIAPIFGYRHHQLRRILNDARALIAPTHFAGQIHQQMGVDADKIKVVPHGIEIPEKLPPRATSHAGLHIGYIGGLSWQKGVHILVEAVNQLPEAGVQLSVIGDTEAFPDYVAQLWQQAQHPGIAFVGRVPPARLWAALAAMDVVVVPSLWYETAALIVQEAFAAGAPVVASEIGALRERVRDGIDGRFFPPGDSTRLHNILHQFWADKTSLEQLQDGIEPVRSIEEHASDIESIYTQIIH